MTTTFKYLRILVADDDVEDVQLVKESLLENQVKADVNEVDNGQALLETLRSTTSNNKAKLKPHLIIMDINMPRKNGFETLKELKADEDLRSIPVVIFTTSKAAGDIKLAYELGANCFITKPQTATEWHNTIGKLGRFWTECASLTP
ncbi:response regulator [Aridibaculum aurantiacum]|uniref:response regulator n=1 Tax=Aridibaculum aurantiacum TaxID=2810307 RepID=UPI001A95E8E6|nr:response regulator [Aridibaculum aurantiacum]